MLNIFISDLTEYNNGILKGEWFDLTTDEGRTLAAAAVSEINEDGHEYFISDYEADYLEISEYEDVDKLIQIGEIIEDEGGGIDLHYLISVLNGYNGSFDHLIAYEMDALEDFMHGQDAHYIACRVYFGEFNPTDEYFNFNGYGNLVSYSEYEYKAALEDEAADIFTEWLETIHGITF